MYRAFNLLSFQVGWLACVWGAASDWPMLGPLVVGGLLSANSFLMSAPGRQLGLVAVVAVLGTLIDSLLAAAGVIGFPHAAPTAWLCPLWMTALWINLGLTLHGCLSWLPGRYPLASLLGAIAGPLAYWGAVQLGALYLAAPWWQTLAGLAVGSALVLPLLVWISQLRPYRVELIDIESTA